MIAFDTSALVKLVRSEAESAALEAWLSSRPADWVASELCRVELLRAAHRSRLPAVRTASDLLASLDLVPLTTVLLEDAAALPPATLGSLDAIHLATALAVAEALEAFVVYDDRLADAARARGLPVVAPR